MMAEILVCLALYGAVAVAFMAKDLVSGMRWFKEVKANPFYPAITLVVGLSAAGVVATQLLQDLIAMGLFAGRP